MTAKRITPDLEARLRARPTTEWSLLVRVTSIEERYDRALEARGLAVRRRMRLVPTYAVSGPGSAALELAQLDWVLSVEEDLPVHTM